MPHLTTLSLGAGLQSSLLCEMAIAGELPRPDVVLFADTGDEPSYVHEQVAYLRHKLQTVNVPLITVRNGHLVEDFYSNSILQTARFATIPLFTHLKDGRRRKPAKATAVPDVTLFDLDDYEQPMSDSATGFGLETQFGRVGRLRRQCTSEYKIVPIEREIRIMLLEMGLATETKNGAIRVKKGVEVESWLGITLDEVQRMKPSRHRWLCHRWPLIEKRMTRADCVHWYKQRGRPVPRKSSCRRCPFHSDAYWLDMKQNQPEDWQEVVAFDHDLRTPAPNGRLRLAATAKGTLYLHRSLLPLDEVSLRHEQQSALFDGCDAGFCWT